MSKMFLWLASVGLTVAIVLVASSLPSGAQNFSRLESRLSRLESENARLRGRIERLEGARRRADFGASSVPPVPRSPDGPREAAADDPMFDRLATLVIELKERVRALEAEVFAEGAQASE